MTSLNKQNDCGPGFDAARLTFHASLSAER